MQRWLGRTLTTALLGVVALFATNAQAQYTKTFLTSDLSGKAPHTDPLLKNAWGIAYLPGQPFWVNDEADGWSTLYDATGKPQSLQVVVPPGSGTGSGTPTGLVSNQAQEFRIQTWVSAFLFATLDGTIQGWSTFNPNSTLIAVNNPHSSYTGLAITHKTSGNFLFAADAANNKVDVFDGNFNLVKSFTDATIPTGFAPFGIQDINGKVYVTWASTSGGTGGYIDIFTEAGVMVKRFTQGAPLNQPWGMAVAPANFGVLSNTLLVTNNTMTGTINGFNLTTGKLVGTMKTSANKPIVINGIWGITFGGGSTVNGKKNQLFFTAGPACKDGYFGVINFQ
jgi:uncharacterized protein (TIGR03118 family)